MSLKAMHAALPALLLGSLAPSAFPAAPSVLRDGGSGATAPASRDDIDDTVAIDVLDESETLDVFAVRPAEGFIGVELSRAGDEKEARLVLGLAPIEELELELGVAFGEDRLERPASTSRAFDISLEAELFELEREGGKFGDGLAVVLQLDADSSGERDGDGERERESERSAGLALLLSFGERVEAGFGVTSKRLVDDEGDRHESEREIVLSFEVGERVAVGLGLTRKRLETDEGDHHESEREIVLAFGLSEDLELEGTALRSDEPDAETEYTLELEYVFAGRWILALEHTRQRGETNELMLGVARALY